MKKHRRLNLNKVSIVSLKNLHTIIGGNTSACTTTFSDDTSNQNCQGDPGGSNNGCSTGTTDPGQYQPTSNTFSEAPDPLLSGADTNCNTDDTLRN